MLCQAFSSRSRSLRMYTDPLPAWMSNSLSMSVRRSMVYLHRTHGGLASRLVHFVFPRRCTKATITFRLLQVENLKVRMSFSKTLGVIGVLLCGGGLKSGLSKHDANVFTPHVMSWICRFLTKGELSFQDTFPSSAGSQRVRQRWSA